MSDGKSRFVPYLRSLCLVALALSCAVVVVTTVLASSAKAIEHSHPPFYSFAELVATPQRFDGRRVVVVGGIKFVSGRAYIGGSGDRFDVRQSICLVPEWSVTDPSGSGQIAELRRFDGLSSVAVRGLYKAKPVPGCLNGNISVSSMEIELD